jgi:transposase-like protein
MRKPRKNYSPEEKFSILKRHLVEGVPVSDLCDELQLNPNIFYAWQKQLFENGASAFRRSRKLETAREGRRQRRQAVRQQQDPPSPPAAKTKPQQQTASPPAAWVDFRNLRQSVTLEQVLKPLGYFDVLRGFGPQRRGPCPLHDQPEERFRSFSVNVEPVSYPL